jgi:hypothetical protein
MRLFVARIACGSLAATLAFGAAVLPARVGAQTLPPYATPGSVPTIGGETIHGVIEAIEGRYRILVRDDRGFFDDVTLRQGTVINPRGLRLSVGMSVTISGFAAGSTFSAVEIDAPYSYDGEASGSTYYNSYPDYGYGYGDYYVGSPAESVTVIQQPIVVQPPVGAVRRVEPPHANRPLRHPLDGKDDAPFLPPYAVPPTAFRASSIPHRTTSAPDRSSDRAWSAPNRAPAAPDRAQAPAPQYRAPAPEYHAPPAPEYHAPPPPPPPRSEPAPPPRENREPSSPAKPH